MESKFLIVEDHARMREILHNWLASEFPHCEIVSCESAEAGLAAVEEFKPDAVIMDIQLPGMSGIDATRVIVRDHPEIRIVILTILDVKEYYAASQEAGAVACISKKRTLEDLLPLLQSLFPDAATRQNPLALPDRPV